MAKYAKKYAKKDSTLSTAKKATKALTLAKKALAAPEFKWFDFDDSLVAPGAGYTLASPYVQTINSVPIGTGPNNRIGNKLMCKSVHCRFLVSPNNNPATSTVTPKLRLLLIYIKDILPGGTPLALSNYLSTPAMADPICALKNEYLKNNYMIMMDKTISLGDGNINGAPTSVDASQDTKFVEYYKRVNFATEWQTVGGPQSKGQLALFVYQDAASIGTSTGAVNVATRIKYQDA